jgi:hypothetical protein
MSTLSPMVAARTNVAARLFVSNSDKAGSETPARSGALPPRRAGAQNIFGVSFRSSHATRS